MTDGESDYALLSDHTGQSIVRYPLDGGPSEHLLDLADSTFALEVDAENIYALVGTGWREGQNHNKVLAYSKREPRSPRVVHELDSPALELTKDSVSIFVLGPQSVTRIATPLQERPRR